MYANRSVVQNLVCGPAAAYGNPTENVNFEVLLQTYWSFCPDEAQKSIFSQTLKEILIMLEFENHYCGLTHGFTPKPTPSIRTLLFFFFFFAELFLKHLQKNILFFYFPYVSKYRTLHHNRTKLTIQQTNTYK